MKEKIAWNKTNGSRCRYGLIDFAFSASLTHWMTIHKCKANTRAANKTTKISRTHMLDPTVDRCVDVLFISLWSSLSTKRHVLFDSKPKHEYEISRRKKYTSNSMADRTEWIDNTNSRDGDDDDDGDRALSSRREQFVSSQLQFSLRERELFLTSSHLFIRWQNALLFDLFFFYSSSFSNVYLRAHVRDLTKHTSMRECASTTFIRFPIPFFSSIVVFFLRSTFALLSRSSAASVHEFVRHLYNYNWKSVNEATWCKRGETERRSTDEK